MVVPISCVHSRAHGCVLGAHSESWQLYYVSFHLLHDQPVSTGVTLTLPRCLEALASATILVHASSSSTKHGAHLKRGCMCTASTVRSDELTGMALVCRNCKMQPSQMFCSRPGERHEATGRLLLGHPKRHGTHVSNAHSAGHAPETKLDAQVVHHRHVPPLGAHQPAS